MSTMRVSYLGGVAYGVAKEPIATELIDTNTSTPVKTAAAAPLSATIAVVWSDTAHIVNTGAFADVTAAATNGIFVPANSERHLAINRGDGVAALAL